MLVSLRFAFGLLLLTIIATQSFPFTISSLQYPDSFHCFIKMDRGSSLEIYSSYFQPNHLSLTTKDLQILIQPPIAPLNLLYNAPSSDKNSMGYIAYLNTTETLAKKTQFHHAKVKINDTWIEYLMPTLLQEIKAIRVDQLYRCSDILISVNWVGNNAQVWKFSQHDQWIHVDDLKEGQISRDDNILYGYAVDQNQEQPIKIRVNYDQFCLLDRTTQPAKINFDWMKKQQFRLSQVLDLVEKNVQVLNKKVISQQL